MISNLIGKESMKQINKTNWHRKTLKSNKLKGTTCFKVKNLQKNIFIKFIKKS
jgi:hypothetical protein